MLGQLNIYGEDKVQVAIKRIKTFEPEDGYYVAFSGGKDSQCILELCKMAGVKYDAHYQITSVDPPELVRFIKEQYPEVNREYPRNKNGEVITMWKLIPERKIPPTRIARYCCQELKESSGKGRVTMTGVRWAESANRKSNQGGVTVFNPSKESKQKLSDENIEAQTTRRGGIVLNLDNAESRRAMEICYRTDKTLINPIIDWEDDDVWEFLNDVAKVPHCTLYDEGYKRLGCIGCPMSTHQKDELERYPKYKYAYIRAFQRMINSFQSQCEWKTGEEVYEWWIGGRSNHGLQREDFV